MLQPRIPFLARALPRFAPIQLPIRTMATKAITEKKPRWILDNPYVRSYKPRTPGVRHLRRPINDHLWKGRAYLPLTIPKKGQGKGGRNGRGRVTVRHRGGGHKRRIRIVDFMRSRPGPHLVERIEYDPGRSAHIALLSEKATGRKSYIVAADGMRAGDLVHSYRAGIPKDLLDSMNGVIDPGVLASKTVFRGNCLPVGLIPVGTQIFCVGSDARRGAVFCRSAGTYAVVTNKEDGSDTTKDWKKTASGNEMEEEKETLEGEKREAEEAGGKKDKKDKKDKRDKKDKKQQTDGEPIMSKFVQVRLQSGEVRRVSRDACATIGVASNVHHQLRQLGKAGRSRWLNIRPSVRGVAMNKVDHPHGGGRGKSKGNRHPVSPWGRHTKSGWKTRPKKKVNKFVIVPRPRNNGARRARKK